MIGLLYLAVGLVVVGKHTREEVDECGGMVVTLIAGGLSAEEEVCSLRVDYHK